MLQKLPRGLRTGWLRSLSGLRFDIYKSMFSFEVKLGTANLTSGLWGHSTGCSLAGPQLLGSMTPWIMSMYNNRTAQATGILGPVHCVLLWLHMLLCLFAPANQTHWLHHQLPLPSGFALFWESPGLLARLLNDDPLLLFVTLAHSKSDCLRILQHEVVHFTSVGSF